MARSEVLFLVGLMSLASPAATADQRVVGPPVRDSTAALAVPLWTPQAPPEADRVLTFESVPRIFRNGRVQLSNGAAVVDTRDWRAVAISTNNARVPCTLTLVGPRVALLAAHCVDAGLPPGDPRRSIIPAEVRFASQTWTLNCDMAPTYRRSPVNPMGAPRSSDDYALCDVEQPGSQRSPLEEVAPEAVDASVILRTSARVQLMGYGCTDLGISDDGRYTYLPSKGRLNMGHDQIEADNVSIYPGVPGTYVRTLSADGGPVLCNGDSGGPAMTSASSGPGRRVVAVNSAMGATETATAAKPAFHSYLSPLGTAAFASFAQDWARQEGVDLAKRKDRRICGLTLAAGTGGCRP